ncbi:hypothetical protein SO694_00043151 [Aureococcus anophagefferens]|uniref:Btz domain-containing protein n=1 Tax=Aureococcus anophagefferens TaxID=44056 RepID=A0ABR1G715_AURAN
MFKRVTIIATLALGAQGFAPKSMPRVDARLRVVRGIHEIARGRPGGPAAPAAKTAPLVVDVEPVGASRPRPPSRRTTSTSSGARSSSRADGPGRRRSKGARLDRAAEEVAWEAAWIAASVSNLGQLKLKQDAAAHVSAHIQPYVPPLRSQPGGPSRTRGIRASRRGGRRPAATSAATRRTAGSAGSAFRGARPGGGGVRATLRPTSGSAARTRPRPRRRSGAAGASDGRAADAPRGRRASVARAKAGIEQEQVRGPLSSEGNYNHDDAYGRGQVGSKTRAGPPPAGWEERYERDRLAAARGPPPAGWDAPPGGGYAQDPWNPGFDEGRAPPGGDFGGYEQGPKKQRFGGARTRNGGHVRVVPPGGDVRGYEQDPRDPRFAAGRAPAGGYEQGPWDPRFEAGPGGDVRGYEQGAWDPRFEAARAPPGMEGRRYAQGPKKQRFAGRRNYDQADAFAHGGPQPRRSRGGRNRWDSSVVPKNDPRSPAMMQEMMQLPNQRNQRTEGFRGGMGR